MSARARQLAYRLKNRRTAIVTRRENDATLQLRNPTDIWREANNQVAIANDSSHSSPGFVAVNTNRPDAEADDNQPPLNSMFSHSNTDNVTIINGTSIKGASPTTRAELMKKFFTTADRQARGYEDASGPINPPPRPRARAEAPEYAYQQHTTSTPVAIPGTPTSLLPPPKSTPHEKDDGGPFKAEMVARMEELQRGQRVYPPCDRCRRLHMDCMKNLTACVGCTKKHAKCAWRDVKEEELRAAFPPLEHPDQRRPTLPQPAAPSPRATSVERPPHTPTEPQHPVHVRRESAPGAPHIAPGSGASMGLPPPDDSPRRAVSETEGSGRTQHGHPQRKVEDEDPDANQRLMQAILDTVDHHARVAAAVEEKERGAERSGENGSERETERDRAQRTMKAYLGCCPER